MTRRTKTKGAVKLDRGLLPLRRSPASGRGTRLGDSRCQESEKEAQALQGPLRVASLTVAYAEEAAKALPLARKKSDILGAARGTAKVQRQETIFDRVFKYLILGIDRK